MTLGPESRRAADAPTAAPHRAASRTPTQPLHRLAKTIRSKNAGAHFYTFDIIFEDHARYDRVMAMGVLTPELIAQRFGVGLDRIAAFVPYPPGNALKITLRRSISSGDVGDSDVYGAQQYAPLLDIEIPWEDPL